MKHAESSIPRELPERLKELRQRRNWSQGQVAKKINVDIQRVSKYERGVLCPTTEVIIRLALLFEVSLDDLLLGGKTDIGKIKNQAILKRIEHVEHLTEERQQIVIAVLDAFIEQQGIEELTLRRQHSSKVG